MFLALLGTHVPRPSAISAQQNASNTLVTFAQPGIAIVLVIEKETTPGSGVWNEVNRSNEIASVSTKEITGYTENGSYRMRFERQGVPSDWTTFTTPDPFDVGPDAPTSVSFTNNGFFGSLTVQPSEPNCTVEYQILDGAVVVSSGSDTSDGALSGMGPYVYPTSDPAHPDSGQARHVRSGFASAWVSDGLP